MSKTGTLSSPLQVVRWKREHLDSGWLRWECEYWALHYVLKRHRMGCLGHGCRLLDVGRSGLRACYALLFFAVGIRKRYMITSSSCLVESQFSAGQNRARKIQLLRTQRCSVPDESTLLRVHFHSPPSYPPSRVPPKAQKASGLTANILAIA
jgi:hypothetical protein